MKILIGLFGLEHFFGGTPAAYPDIAARAEALGVDGVTVTDHVVMGERTDKYPFGEFPLPPEAPWYDPLIVLSQIAVKTRKIRLGTGVIIAPLRGPALLAKQAGSLDSLCSGRLDLGVGSGWQEEEYQAQGIEFKDRNKRFWDVVAAVKTLWRDKPASYQSEFFDFKNIHCYPSGGSEGGPPLLFGFRVNDDTAAMMAKHGDGWIPINTRPEFIGAGVSALKKAFEEEGRDPEDLRVRGQLTTAYKDGRGDLEATLKGLQDSLDAGLNELEFFPASFIEGAEQLEPFLERVVELKR